MTLNLKQQILSKDPQITFIHGDCMDFIKDLPDKAFDLAIVDPPYGIDVGRMNMGSRQTVKPDKDKKWDCSPPDQSYFDELVRVSSNQIVWGGNYFNLPPTRGFVVWDKAESMYGRSFAECEFAWTSFDESARIYKLSPNDNTRIHPTQKPISLYRWLLKNYAKPGDTILDTHLGSASSAIAAYKEGFTFTGIELDEDYYNASIKRFKQQTAQMPLFSTEEFR